MSDKYLLNLQEDIAFRNAKIKKGKEYDQIKKY